MTPNTPATDVTEVWAVAKALWDWQGQCVNEIVPLPLRERCWALFGPPEETHPSPTARVERELTVEEVADVLPDFWWKAWYKVYQLAANELGYEGQDKKHAADALVDFLRKKCSPACRFCNRPLDPNCGLLADGCPCNSPRGVNHGIVPTNLCTCVECDPAQTGSARSPAVDVERAVAEEREALIKAMIKSIQHHYGWSGTAVETDVLNDAIRRARGETKTDIFEGYCEYEPDALAKREGMDDAALMEEIKNREDLECVIQRTHVALGGDGEWVAKIPGQEPPNSGDLSYDVPVLAKQVVMERDAANGNVDGLLKTIERLRTELAQSKADLAAAQERTECADLLLGNGWQQVVDIARGEQGVEGALRIQCTKLAGDVMERDEQIAALTAERDAHQAELAGIDAVLARRPALDKPTRRENIEHAINTARRADEAERQLEEINLAAVKDRDRLIEACNEAGWNGVDNSKFAWEFITDLAAERDELRRRVEELTNNTSEAVLRVTQITHDQWNKITTEKVEQISALEAEKDQLKRDFDTANEFLGANSKKLCDATERIAALEHERDEARAEVERERSARIRFEGDTGDFITDLQSRLADSEGRREKAVEACRLAKRELWWLYKQATKENLDQVDENRKTGSVYKAWDACRAALAPQPQDQPKGE